MTFFFWHFFSDWIFFWKFWTTKISMRSKVIKFFGTYGDPGRPRCMAGFKPCATLVGWKLIWNHVQRTICPHFLARFLWCRFEMGHFMARFLSRPIKAFFLASWNIFFQTHSTFFESARGKFWSRAHYPRQKPDWQADWLLLIRTHPTRCRHACPELLWVRGSWKLEKS